MSGFPASQCRRGASSKSDMSFTEMGRQMKTPVADSCLAAQLDMLLQLFERTAGASFSGNPHEYNALCTLASVRLGSNLRVVFLRQL